MVEWLAGNRIIGTSAERASSPIVSSKGGWKELGRFNLESNDTGGFDKIINFATKDFIQVIGMVRPSTDPQMRVGTTTPDSSANKYASNQSHNWGSWGSGDINSNHTQTSGGFTSDGSFFNLYILNKTGQQKTAIQQTCNANGTGVGSTTNVPAMTNYVWKYIETPKIDRFSISHSSGTLYSSGTEVVVLGWDPTDTHTDNFWEELGSADLASGKLEVTFAAKKYLWVEVYGKNGTGSGIDQVVINLGAGSVDASNNYAHRYSADWASGATLANRPNINVFDQGSGSGAGDNESFFSSMFIGNHADREKLIIMNSVSDNANTSSGSSSSNPPSYETAGKWGNTTQQATFIRVENKGSGGLLVEGKIKVWGHD